MPATAPEHPGQSAGLSQKERRARLSMLVATRNRQGYLRHILDSYSGSGLNILVADTSPAPLAGVERYPDVNYRHFTECRYTDKLRLLVESAPTELVVLRAENRHLTLSGIDRCLELMLSRPDCALAHGAHVWVRRKRGRLEAWPCSHQDGLAGLMQEDPAERLLAAFDPMVSLYYAVERRQNLLDALDLCEGITNLNALEVLMTAVKAVNGKCARVPALFCAVQERKSALKSPALYAGVDTLASRPEHREQWETLNRAMALHLSRRAGLAQEQARAVVDESMARFLRNLAPRPETPLARLGRKTAKLLRSAARLAGLPDLAAGRAMDDYLSRLEGDARGQYRELLAVIERGYRLGW